MEAREQAIAESHSHGMTWPGVTLASTSNSYVCKARVASL